MPLPPLAPWPKRGLGLENSRSPLLVPPVEQIQGGSRGVHGAATTTAGVYVRDRRVLPGRCVRHAARRRRDNQGVPRQPPWRGTHIGQWKPFVDVVFLLVVLVGVFEYQQ